LTSGGIQRDSIRIGGGRDDVISLRGEMREEMDETLMGPGPVGPFTKEMRRRLAWLVPACALAGAIVLLPLAFLPVHLSLVLRLIIAAVVGAAAGATIGFVLGGGSGMKPRTTRLAAERGVTVAVRSGDPDQAAWAVEEMKRHDPIRVDLTTPLGQPTAMATTEERRTA
jgi:hypothetical protein